MPRLQDKRTFDNQRRAMAGQVTCLTKALQDCWTVLGIPREEHPAVLQWILNGNSALNYFENKK